jgi:dihydrofolate reductase
LHAVTRAQKGKDIWMMGGAGNNASLLDADEMGEFMVRVIQTMIGEGIPLIAPRHGNACLSGPKPLANTVGTWC